MKILLVDDSRALAALIAARLSAFGHEVSLAENGRTALERFCESAPDLVLMDIEMPVMDGFEATSHIRAFEATQQWAWTPIVFLTASDTPENLVTAIEAGGDDFMSKMAPEAVLQAKMKAMKRIARLRQELAAANRKLEELASRDGLTGLFNRRYMDLRLDAAWQEAERLGRSFGLLMFDVDHFKKYNDHYGHLAGDDVLRAIASISLETVETSNKAEPSRDAFVARYGGEEFLVVMPATSAAAWEEMAANILKAVRSLEIPHEGNGDWGIATVSIGGARLDVANGRIADLFRTADEHLYRAKENGRNRAELI